MEITDQNISFCQLQFKAFGLYKKSFTKMYKIINDLNI